MKNDNQGKIYFFSRVSEYILTYPDKYLRYIALTNRRWLCKLAIWHLEDRCYDL